MANLIKNLFGKKEKKAEPVKNTETEKKPVTEAKPAAPKAEAPKAPAAPAKAAPAKAVPAKAAPAKAEAPKAAAKADAQKKEPAKAETKGKYIVKVTDGGSYTFNVMAANKEIIARSQVYKSKSSCLNGIESVKNNAPVAAIEDQTLENFEEETNPKFEIYVDKSGAFRFRLKAANGSNILGSSQGYTTKASCKNGIESVKTNSASDVIFEEEQNA